MSNDILVITEHMDGKIADISYEMVGKARELAVALGGRVVALMLQPTGQCGQMLGTSVSSHGRAPKRKSAVVSAPTGQMSVVLPLK